MGAKDCFVHRLALALTAAIVLPSGLPAQQVQLSDSDIAEALSAGARAKGRQQGLELRNDSGFDVEVFTPTMWLRQAASEAAAQGRVLTHPVPAEVLAPVLRIIVYPAMPRRTFGSGASVASVLLRDKARRIAIQPDLVESFAVRIERNDFGPPVDLNGIRAQFPLGALKTVQDARGEFVITVVSAEGREQEVHVRRRHLDQLK